MSTFHHRPDWQQSADRHTRLTDPVLTVRQLSRFDLSLKHLVRIDHALVFSTPKGGYEPFLPPRRPTRGEIAKHRYTAVYEVDMGVHPFTETLVLPSDNDAFEFAAEIDVSWQVLDPARFVASGVRDVPALLLGELQQAARPVARRFPREDSAGAERELLKAAGALGPLGAPAGLQVTWGLRLRRNQADIDHQQRLQAIDHSAAEQIRVAEQGMQVDVEMDRRHRQQDALQLGRTMEYGRQQQELVLQQQHWQHEQALLNSGQHHELARLQAQHMLEMQRFEAEKIAFYQWHLQQGGVQAWALHLAQHPDDSHLVMRSMRDDQLRMIQAQMDLVKELLGGNAAEKFELEGPKQLALRTVSDILNQRLPGVSQDPAPLPPGPGLPHAPSTGPETADGHEATPSDGVAAGGGGPAGPTDPDDDDAGAPPASGPGTGFPDPYTVPSPPFPTTPPTAAPAPAPGGPGTPDPPYPAPGTSAAAPGAPGPYAWQPPVPSAPPPPPPPVTAGAPAPYPMPQGAPWAPPAWQPPPGYGTTPTAPPRRNTAPEPAGSADPAGTDGPEEDRRP
ncbi:hypothetical protein GCM10010145_36370 [Streptomyces ruber]|uniref:PE-PGRS family protein n=2 Tax=Streptomyces TaxID=1883 RepID=A0A918BH07_9ACTN|nr:hypothetical protein [Streptomyces ruber]GGQ63178.1 hypothetical protein GCM10010145_36370 [Streptomyces ruber]